ncbi:hypothetical protein [Salinispora arenicola]|uniref:hypothetical protein n=1 Tax=Salinispora arenicola TaxID=168697 RepID=UPI00047F9F8E|nr:hypothetical protein [Salinispora arenicola]
MVKRTIPTTRDLASSVIVDSFDDMVNPPGLTNFLGAAQVDHDIVALRSINFAPLSHGDTITGQLYLDGRLFRSHGTPVSVVWRPDHVQRSTRVDDIVIETVTACPPRVTGVVVDVRVTNDRATPRTVRLGLALSSSVTDSGGPWLRSEPPSEPNQLTVHACGRAAVGTASSSAAASVQGVDVTPSRLDPDFVEVTLQLAAGQSRRFGFVHVVATDVPSALATFEALSADVPGAVAATTRMWDAELEAMFTPGNSSFSGHLPVLETDNEALRTLYWWGALGVLWFRRDNPASVLGRTYDTLMPRYWQTTTFIWDFSLSSLVHGLLDPEPMRRHIEHWISTDIHAHFGTEWLTGAPVGYWYSVNDYAMTRLVRDYVRFSGDRAFLDKAITPRTGAKRRVAEHLLEWATAWQGLRGRHELADYGEIDNLLECVSSYIHEVASLNASNVWCLRVAAEVADLEGRPDHAVDLRCQANDLAAAVNRLYVAGAGFWHARQPDGTLVAVRHCYDFATVGTTIAQDLTGQQRAEMTDFFVRELQTPTWMRALSPYDRDAAFSLRPDHQWNGAYPAWPADSARALFLMGSSHVAAEWLPGLAKSANQGPCGQAHYVEDAEAPIAGGARKAPPQFPYLTDWACSSSGAWVSLVIEGVFGIEVSLAGEVTAKPQLRGLDPQATLRGLAVAGRSYDVTAVGVVDAAN